MQLGELVTNLRELRTQRTAINSQAKEMGREIEELEGQLLVHLDEIGVDSVKVGANRVTATVKTLPRVTDWDAVYKYIRDNNAFFLLQRRITTTSYAETIKTGEVIPGTEVYEQRVISLTKR